MQINWTDIETEVVKASEIDHMWDMVWYGGLFREAGHRVSYSGSIRFYFLNTAVSPDHLVRRAVRPEDARDLMNKKFNADRDEFEAGLKRINDEWRASRK
jgi:hypothetical protein